LFEKLHLFEELDALSGGIMTLFFVQKTFVRIWIWITEMPVLLAVTDIM
jgi:hypothetical protein